MYYHLSTHAMLEKFSYKTARKMMYKRVTGANKTIIHFMKVTWNKHLNLLAYLIILILKHTFSSVKICLFNYYLQKESSKVVGMMF